MMEQAKDRTFGFAIMTKRKELRLTQGQLLMRNPVLMSLLNDKELNDLEHDRRDPRDERLVRALSTALAIPFDQLHLLSIDYERASRLQQELRATERTKAFAFRARYNRG